MTVSHDQSFLAAACEEYWVIAKKKVQRIRGTFADYKRALVKELQK